jgi:hypothetical protein
VELPSHDLSFPPCRSQSTALPLGSFPSRWSFTFIAGVTPRCCCVGELLPRRCPSCYDRVQVSKHAVPVCHGLGVIAVKIFPGSGPCWLIAGHTTKVVAHVLCMPALALAARAPRSVGRSRPHGPLDMPHRVLLDSVGRPKHTVHAGPPRRCRAVGLFKIENHFLFSFSLNLNSKCENSYLSAQSSKNYETSSVGFIILGSI